MRFQELATKIRTRTQAEFLLTRFRGHGTANRDAAEAYHVLNRRPYVRVHGSVFNLIKLLPPNVSSRDFILPKACGRNDPEFFARHLDTGEEVSIRTVEFRLPEGKEFAGCIVTQPVLASQKALDPPNVYCYTLSSVRRKYLASGLHDRCEMLAVSEIDLDPELRELFDIIYLYFIGSCCLLDPVVLADDQAAYDATQDIKYLEKAQRRGVIGWDMGKKIEVGPHVRRPHFGIRWKGHGTYRPEIVPIRGSIINGQKLKLPEGYKPALDN